MPSGRVSTSDTAPRESQTEGPGRAPLRQTSPVSELKKAINSAVHKTRSIRVQISHAKSEGVAAMANTATQFVTTTETRNCSASCAASRSAKNTDAAHSPNASTVLDSSGCGDNKKMSALSNVQASEVEPSTRSPPARYT